MTANTKIGSIRKAAAKMSSQNISNNEVNQRKRLERSAFVTQQGNFVGGGTSVVLDALAAYLRYLEGTARYEWQEYVLAAETLFCDSRNHITIITGPNSYLNF